MCNDDGRNDGSETRHRERSGGETQRRRRSGDGRQIWASLVAVKRSAKLRLLVKNREDAGAANNQICVDGLWQNNQICVHGRTTRSASTVEQPDLRPRQNNQICVHGSDVAGGASNGGRERDGGQGKRWWCVNGGGGDSGGGGGQIRVFLL
ncbi:hypothetical protein LR48_Vigan05g130800 [Vigna angularis]|uniref:Uncharacterized protein n=1 Tax=Phaseolus angularis TaxID=3914 RepID=A0A0L9ULS5_PHAAN|nr:hypothetical protein LR48_Vigan05g130800 [Vigna angularis]